MNCYCCVKTFIALLYCCMIEVVHCCISVIPVVVSELRNWVVVTSEPEQELRTPQDRRGTEAVGNVTLASARSVDPSWETSRCVSFTAQDPAFASAFTAVAGIFRNLGYDE